MRYPNSNSGMHYTCILSVGPTPKNLLWSVQKISVILIKNMNLQACLTEEISSNTVESQHNKPRREMKNSSLYQEFVKSKIGKIRSFCSNIKYCVRVVHLYIFFPIS